MYSYNRCIATAVNITVDSHIGWVFGDPHIRTLDGLEYSFNGLGEYMLVATTDKTFTLQGRTLRALDSKRNEMQATVFSAFAAQDADSDRFHVQMNSDRDGEQIHHETEISMCTEKRVCCFVTMRIVSTFS